MAEQIQSVKGEYRLLEHANTWLHKDNTLLRPEAWKAATSAGVGRSERVSELDNTTSQLSPQGQSRCIGPAVDTQPQKTAEQKYVDCNYCYSTISQQLEFLQQLLA